MSAENLLPITEAFIQEVHVLVAAIPRGKVATYGQIAAKAGEPKAGREVGLIMSRVPEATMLPCHRVVNKTGVLAPDYAFGGQEKQCAMLEAEGIPFLPDGRIDIERCLWGEPEQLTLF